MILRTLLPALMAGFLAANAIATEAPAVVRPLRRNLAVENLGSPVAFCSVRSTMVYQAPHSGHYHLFIQLEAYNGFASPPDPQAQFVDINLDTAEVRTAMSGIPNGGGQALLHPSGKLYIGGTRPPSLIEFDTANGKVRHLGNLTPGFLHSVQCLDLGPDGAVYFGHYGRHATRYDPATGEMRDFGPMDGTGYMWLYNILADGRYLYARMSDGWYLVVHDTHTGEQTVYRTLTGDLRRDKHGNIRFANQIFQDGRPLQPGEAPRPVAKPVPMPAQMLVQDAERELGFEFDLAGLQPNNWNAGQIEVRWRRGEEDWRTAVCSGIAVTPNVPNVLAATPEGGIIGAGSGIDMPLFRIDPRTGESQPLGIAPGHVYRILATADRAYFAGYRSQFLVYDRHKPWTLRGSRGYAKGDPNPVKLSGPGMRTCLLALGADGRIFVAGNNERHRRGGDLTIFDPATGTQVSLRNELKAYSLADMCAVDDGRAIAWSAAHRKDGTVHLFVYNVPEQRIERRLDVALPAPGWMIPVAEGVVLGVVGLDKAKAGPPIHEALVYKLDIRTGEVLFQCRVPGIPFTGPGGVDRPLWPYWRELVKGPDGCAWLFIDRTLTRIHPDGTIEKVLEMAHGGRVLFVGDDLFIYGSGRRFFGGFTQILRITCPFDNVAPVTNP